MSKFARVAGRLFNAPLMLRPEKAEILRVVLLERMGLVKADSIDATTLGASQVRQRAGDWYDAPPKTARDMYVVEDGVATIAVDGTLVHKLGGVEPWCGMIGYDSLDKIASDARENSDVGAILIDMDSPGGEVNGCFELAKSLYKSSARFGGKPVFAFANEMACSAGYAIAAACDRVATTETGVTGSIGVWTMLVDMTKGLDKNGISVRMIRAGDRKARGGPYEVADDETVAKLLAWVEDTRMMFGRLVAQCRGLSVDAVLSQEGDWYAGEEGLRRGLVDAVDSPDAVMEAARRAAWQYLKTR